MLKLSENFSAIKIGKHIPSGYSMSTSWSFDHIEKKHNLYHGKDCMKRFYRLLREHVKNITDFEKMLPLKKEKLKSHQDAKICYICAKIILKRLWKYISDGRFWNHYYFIGKHRDVAHSICNLKRNVLS